MHVQFHDFFQSEDTRKIIYYNTLSFIYTNPQSMTSSSVKIYESAFQCVIIRPILLLDERNCFMIFLYIYLFMLVQTVIFIK